LKNENIKIFIMKNIKHYLAISILFLYLPLCNAHNYDFISKKTSNYYHEGGETKDSRQGFFNTLQVNIYGYNGTIADGAVFNGIYLTGGYRYHNTAATSIGAGYTIDYYDKQYIAKIVNVPLFITGRYYFRKNTPSPFFNFKIGKNIVLNKTFEERANKIKGGLLTGSGLGVEVFNFNHFSFNAGIYYELKSFLFYDFPSVLEKEEVHFLHSVMIKASVDIIY